MNWIKVDPELPLKDIPLETSLIVKHSGGVEAIHFYSGQWRYWYVGTGVQRAVLQSITHYCIPE